MLKKTLEAGAVLLAVGCASPDTTDQSENPGNPTSTQAQNLTERDFNFMRGPVRLGENRHNPNLGVVSRDVRGEKLLFFSDGHIAGLGNPILWIPSDAVNSCLELAAAAQNNCPEQDNEVCQTQVATTRDECLGAVVPVELLGLDLLLDGGYIAADVFRDADGNLKIIFKTDDSGSLIGDLVDVDGLLEVRNLEILEGGGIGSSGFNIVEMPNQDADGETRIHPYLVSGANETTGAENLHNLGERIIFPGLEGRNTSNCGAPDISETVAGGNLVVGGKYEDDHGVTKCTPVSARIVEERDAEGRVVAIRTFEELAGNESIIAVINDWMRRRRIVRVESLRIDGKMIYFTATEGNTRSLYVILANTPAQQPPDAGVDAAPPDAAAADATAPDAAVLPPDADTPDVAVEPDAAAPPDAQPPDAELPQDSTPADGGPTDSEPAATDTLPPGDANPADALPADAAPTDSLPADARPADSQPAPDVAPNPNCEILASPRETEENIGVVLDTDFIVQTNNCRLRICDIKVGNINGHRITGEGEEFCSGKIRIQDQPGEIDFSFTHTENGTVKIDCKLLPGEAMNCQRMPRVRALIAETLLHLNMKGLIGGQGVNTGSGGSKWDEMFVPENPGVDDDFNILLVTSFQRPNEESIVVFRPDSSPLAIIPSTSGNYGRTLPFKFDKNGDYIEEPFPQFRDADTEPPTTDAEVDAEVQPPATDDPAPSCKCDFGLGETPIGGAALIALLGLLAKIFRRRERAK